MEIHSEKGALVHQETGTLDVGYNVMKYDLSIATKHHKNFQKKHKNTVLKSSKNGIHYLPKGTYTLKVFTEQHTDEAKLVIE